MSTHVTEVRDLDHVVMPDGQVYRIVGNLDHPAKFVGYNVYSPHPGGDRLFRGKPYRKNYTEDDALPQDALDTYAMLPRARICEHLEPRPFDTQPRAAHHTSTSARAALRTAPSPGGATAVPPHRHQRCYLP